MALFLCRKANINTILCRILSKLTKGPGHQYNGISGSLIAAFPAKILRQQTIGSLILQRNPKSMASSVYNGCFTAVNNL